jgi:hypothetical protein
MGCSSSSEERPRKALGEKRRNTSEDGPRGPHAQPGNLEDLAESDRNRIENEANRQAARTLHRSQICGTHSSHRQPASQLCAYKQNSLAAGDCKLWSVTLMNPGQDHLLPFIEGRFSQDPDVTEWIHNVCGSYYRNIPAVEQCTRCGKPVGNNFKIVCRMR